VFLIFLFQLLVTLVTSNLTTQGILASLIYWDVCYDGWVSRWTLGWSVLWLFGGILALPVFSFPYWKRCNWTPRMQRIYSISLSAFFITLQVVLLFIYGYGVLKDPPNFDKCKDEGKLLWVMNQTVRNSGNENSLYLVFVFGIFLLLLQVRGCWGLFDIFLVFGCGGERLCK
jgi:hypothetical protein